MEWNLLFFFNSALLGVGLAIGKKFGTKYAGKAGILGGVILIVIGIEIFVTGVF